MNKRRDRPKRGGFTMIELMAVLIIMGLLFAVVAQNFMGRTEGAKVTTTEASLKVLHTSVNMFKMDTGRYPTEDEGLLALVEQPLDLENYPLEGYLDLTEVPLDGWNREFIYQEYPESGKPFVIISWGADGEEGGEGHDTDLLSTNR